ncbi:MAG: hypothetical protein K9M98_13700 [Cephaloticoccus sp.]|nr:hypothetical protein [Cephaloticoccus sp.]MCF7761548.1 hypothetical protein [Cephaloticoccus sp.]
MAPPSQTLFQAIEEWIMQEPAVCAAVLFGSSARQGADIHRSDQWSDFDIHLVTSAPEKITQVDWNRLMPAHKYRLHDLRPATGGVHKLTVLFETGQIDLVIVPVTKLRLARIGFGLGLERINRQLKLALNEINTCIRDGYQIIKGGESWGKFYAKVATQMKGVRLSDREAVILANRSLVDLVWIRQKITRGELGAAQHLLHHSLAETNYRLLRELRLRRDQPLPSFGLGRHVERLLPPTELAWVRIDARCDPVELARAAEQSSDGMKSLMRLLVPNWTAPSLPGTNLSSLAGAE